MRKLKQDEARNRRSPIIIPINNQLGVYSGMPRFAALNFPDSPNSLTQSNQFMLPTA